MHIIVHATYIKEKKCDYSLTQYIYIYLLRIRRLYKMADFFKNILKTARIES